MDTIRTSDHGRRVSAARWTPEGRVRRAIRELREHNDTLTDEQRRELLILLASGIRP